MGWKCVFFGHVPEVKFELLSFGYVTKKVKCKKCDGFNSRDTFYNMSQWKEIKAKEGESIKVDEELRLEKGKQYTFKGMKIDDVPPCAYEIILKHRDGKKDKVLVKLQTNVGEKDINHMLATPKVLDGDKIASIVCVAKALKSQSSPALELDIVEGVHYGHHYDQ